MEERHPTGSVCLTKPPNFYSVEKGREEGVADPLLDISTPPPFSEDETNVQTGGCSSSSTSWAALSGESNYYSTFSKDCGKEYVIYLLQ